MSFHRSHFTDNLSPAEQKLYWDAHPDELTDAMDQFYPPEDRVGEAHRWKVLNGLDVRDKSAAERAADEQAEQRAIEAELMAGLFGEAERVDQDTPEVLSSENSESVGAEVASHASTKAALAEPIDLRSSDRSGATTFAADSATTTPDPSPTTASGPPKAKPKWSYADAGFPRIETATLSTATDPVAEMNQLARELRSHGDYHRIRERYVRASLGMNRDQRMAPAFRPRISVPGGLSEINKLIHLDRLVIDLHWLHSSGCKLLPRDNAYGDLMDRAIDFDFNAAWALASRNHRGGFRAAEALCLPVSVQVETITLREQAVKDRADKLGIGWKESKGKSKSRTAIARQQIAQWARDDKRISSEIETYVNLWLARELLGEGATNASIARLHALMMCAPEQDRKNIRDKLERLDKRLGLAHPKAGTV